MCWQTDVPSMYLIRAKVNWEFHCDWITSFILTMDFQLQRKCITNITKIITITIAEVKINSGQRIFEDCVRKIAAQGRTEIIFGDKIIRYIKSSGLEKHISSKTTTYWMGLNPQTLEIAKSKKRKF